MRALGLVFLFLMSAMSGNAQFNSKIGYSGAYMDFSSVNDLLTGFDDANEWLDSKFGGIHFIHGLEVGGRYKVHKSSIELGLVTSKGNALAVGIPPSMQTKEEYKWRASVFEYHLNLVHQFSFMGMGAGISSQNLTMKQLNTVSDEYVEITNQSKMAFSVFLNLEAASSTVSAAIRPYYKRTLGDYNVSDMAAALGTSPDLSTTLSPSSFGISILFFNGPQ